MATLKALLKSYSPTTAPARPGRSADPITARREKFLRAINDQLALVDDPEATRSVRRKPKAGANGAAVKGRVETAVKIKPWWSTDAAGAVVLTPRFGLAPLQWAPGQTSLMIGRPDDHALKHALQQLAAACEGRRA